MRELTFAGFLKSYVRSLSLCDSLRITSLVQEAEEQNLRLKEPLVLYALFCGKEELLLTASKGLSFQEECEKLLSRYNPEEMQRSFVCGDPSLPQGYHKVWHSYLSRKNQLQTDNATKQLMRQRILKLQADSGVSNYRIYTALGLNPGNLNAWLKYGTSEKVSLNTARKTLNYLKTHTR
jgi:hypothetical protein